VKARALAAATLAHAALLLAPLVAMGRARALQRPQAAAIVVTMLTLAIVEGASRRRADPSRFGAPGTGLALASAVGLLACTWLALGWPSSPSSPAGAWTWAGAPLAAAGILLRAAAIRALGDGFTSETVLAPGRAIAAHGPYAWLRHPSEIGLLLVASGVATLGASAAAAGALIPLAVASAFRVRSEARLLIADR
jgi:protein-S-isoprenylcysteine O-methyltransferase Ste14